MEIIPVHIWNSTQGNDKTGGSATSLEQPALQKVMQARRGQLHEMQVQDSSSVQDIALNNRVIIIEGISGSGKDTFQKYLKKQLVGREIYDYSEGEVLHSWKQFQIEGIFEIRVKFMNCFLNYVKNIISRDDNAVFLLNRFHLSTYAWTIIQRQTLGAEYDEIINVLRMLPVHVFILQVDKNEIEKRSLHPERSGAWQKFQQQILANHTFCDRLERQQKLILDAAKVQQIPYSVIKLPPYEYESRHGMTRILKEPSIVRCNVRMNAHDTKNSRRKRNIPRTL